MPSRVLVVGDAEEDQRGDAQGVRLPGLLHRLIHREVEDAGHGRDRPAHALPLHDEEREDEIVGSERRFTDHAAQGLGATQAAGAVDGEGHGAGHDNGLPVASVPQTSAGLGYAPHMHALHVRGLTKTFGGRFGRRQEALRGIDLTLAQGVGFGLIGPNGAGKTTFIKSLLGIVRPTEGRDRRCSAARPPTRPSGARIGYLPERLHLPAADTPLTFLTGVSRLKGLRPVPRELEALVGSRGPRRRRGPAHRRLLQGHAPAAGARRGAARPTGSADPRRAHRRHRSPGPGGGAQDPPGELARGATLFLNSHLLSETERICDSLGILSAGRLVRQGPLASLRQLRSSWLARSESTPDEAALREAGFTPSSRGAGGSRSPGGGDGPPGPAHRWRLRTPPRSTRSWTVRAAPGPCSWSSPARRRISRASWPRR